MLTREKKNFVEDFKPAWLGPIELRSDGLGAVIEAFFSRRLCGSLYQPNQNSSSNFKFGR